MRKFTEEGLRQYNGSNGIVYIACYGKVYDVSGSYHWRRGVHHARHHAGYDLSQALKQAPHGLDLLQRFPVVGELVAEENAKT